VSGPLILSISVIEKGQRHRLWPFLLPVVTKSSGLHAWMRLFVRNAIRVFERYE